MGQDSPALGCLLCLLFLGGPVLLGLMVARRSKQKLRASTDRVDTEGLVTCEGFTAGLAASGHATRIHALLQVSQQDVVVARSRLSGGSPVTERFAAAELLSVHEDEFRMTGVQGVIADQNVKRPLGRLLGASNTVPGLLLRTRRGDLVFVVERKHQVRLREAYLAICGLLGSEQR